MYIKVQFSEDVLFHRWSSDDLAQYNIGASMDRYAEHLVNYLYADYPQAHIEVTQGSIDFYSVNGDRGHEEVDAIKDIAGKVYNDSDWEVSK